MSFTPEKDIYLSEDCLIVCVITVHTKNAMYPNENMTVLSTGLKK